MVFFMTGTGSVCDGACCREEALSPQPFQPEDRAVIACTRKKQGQKYRSFSPAWYSSYPWLTLCTTRYKVYCTYCRYCSRKGLLGLARKGEENFIEAGFDNWKKAHERFSQHAKSSLHKEAVFKIEQLKHDSVHALLCKQAASDQKIHREMLLIQLSTLQYLLRQGMAIRGHHETESNLTQPLLLRSHEIPQLKSAWLDEKKYCSPEIQNEQIALMGLCVLRNLLRISEVNHTMQLLQTKQLMLATRNNLLFVYDGWMMTLRSMKTQSSLLMFHKQMQVL